jgi:hypothetical protein
VKVWIRKSFPLLAIVAAAATIAACDETLEGGLGCSVLCPEQPAALLQDTLFAVELDTTLGGFPSTGAEQQLLLAVRGDTLDARAIVRFDSLPVTFRHANTVADSSIVEVDSARLWLRVAGADTLGPAITVELYDVDVTAGDDTAAATLVPLFEPSRFLGSRTFDSTEMKDSLLVPVDPAILLAKIQDTTGRRRLRVGIRITAAASAQIRVWASNSGFLPRLIFRPSPDTTVAEVHVGAESRTPNIPFIAADLLDFQIIAVAPPPAPPNVLRIGGVPGRRAYLRFNIPPRIIDSSTIVRAQLLLTQSPNPGGAASADTGSVQPFALASGGVLTDIQRVLLFLAAGFDTTRTVPADSGVRAMELIQIVRSWRGTSAALTPRAVAIRALTEGSTPWQVDFFSREAPLAVRPRLVITYVPQPLPRVP